MFRSRVRLLQKFALGVIHKNETQQRLKRNEQRPKLSFLSLPPKPSQLSPHPNGGSAAGSQTSLHTRMKSTRISRHIDAPRTLVYESLLDASAVAAWIAPEGMMSWIHAFDPSEGGVFRFSFTGETPTTGRAGPITDTFHGLFVKLVPNERVVEMLEIESANPDLRGKMLVTLTLTDSAQGGTEILVVHSELPPALPPERMETGWKKALDRLAEFVAGAVHHA